MNEFRIKDIFENLVEQIIIPKYPFLKIQSLKPPSESMNPFSTVFFLVFETRKKVTYKLLAKVEEDVKNLFSSAGFSFYPYRDFQFQIRVAIDDLSSDERYYNMESKQ